MVFSEVKQPLSIQTISYKKISSTYIWMYRFFSRCHIDNRSKANVFRLTESQYSGTIKLASLQFRIQLCEGFIHLPTDTHANIYKFTNSWLCTFYAVYFVLSYDDKVIFHLSPMDRNSQDAFSCPILNQVFSSFVVSPYIR